MMRPLLKGMTMKTKTAVLISVFAAAAGLGIITKTIIDLDDENAKLMNELLKSKFKTRVYRHSFEAALAEVPADRVKHVRKKIESEVAFEEIVAQF
jgi:hypothetical protein